MDGIFLKKKYSLILIIISGIFLFLLFGYIWLFDVTVSQDNNFSVVFFVFFGIFCMVFGFIAFFFNFRAYLHIKDDHISARFNWNTRLECDFAEIVFINSYYTYLLIKLNNGKRYNILKLKNADKIYAEIRKYILKSETQTSSFNKDILLSKIKKIAHKQRNEWIFIIIGLVTLFANIFICVALTHEKDLPEFNRQDWIVFGIFSVVETVAVIILFFATTICGKSGALLREEKLFLRQSVIINSPALPGSFGECILTIIVLRESLFSAFPMRNKSILRSKSLILNMILKTFIHPGFIPVLMIY